MREQRTHEQGDRYVFDWLLKPKDGWAQIDTGSDASYFGQWANPVTKEFISYCEGDIYKADQMTDEEFSDTIKQVVAFHERMGDWKGIDGMCCAPIIEKFSELGLSSYMH